MNLSPAPQLSYRLIPSRFPPIGLFDTVATAADLAAVMDLVGWTNDRLVVERLRRLPQADWVFGRPNSSVVMASFLHVAPGGVRFNDGELGARYAAAALRTAVAEVGHHLRREAVATGAATLKRTYRAYTASLGGRFTDLKGQQAARTDIYDAISYAASQASGAGIRSSGGHGILYDSLRHVSGVNVAAYRTHDIRDVVQTDHFGKGQRGRPQDRCKKIDELTEGPVIAFILRPRSFAGSTSRGSPDASTYIFAVPAGSDRV